MNQTCIGYVRKTHRFWYISRRSYRGNLILSYNSRDRHEPNCPSLSSFRMHRGRVGGIEPNGATRNVRERHDNSSTKPNDYKSLTHSDDVSLSNLIELYKTPKGDKNSRRQLPVITHVENTYTKPVASVMPIFLSTAYFPQMPTNGLGARYARARWRPITGRVPSSTWRVWS